jgi:16S rRNA (guanine(966)-N(2))-methyltransferase RsmD
MTRITGGIGKGRKLRVPAGLRVRPTADKVKQALFNILGERIEHAAFLDLYAGTGGIGIEALSRGAGKAVFVDDSGESLRVARQNIEESGLSELAQVVPAKAESFLRKTFERFDIVFLDPPYSIEQQHVLDLISMSEILKRDSIVISEHFKKQKSPETAGRLALYREAVYGDTVLAFYKIVRD